MDEAVGFAAQMDAFEDSEGFRFSYLVALFEGEDGGVASRTDARKWAEQTSLPGPVVSDPLQVLARGIPFEGDIPFRCALTPRMETMGCFTGQPTGPDAAIEAIRTHARESAGVP